MKVKILVGAAAAYACIKTDTGSYDVRLDAGRSAPTSLRESAAQLRESAARLIRNADLYEAAAVQLELEKA